MLKSIIAFLAPLVIVTTIAAQNVVVSGAAVGNGSYPTLTAAFAAINSGFQSATTISVTVTNDTWEGSGTALLNYTGWASLTIAPNGQPRTIAGATTPGQPMVDLNGVRFVNVSGNLLGQAGLTFFNNSTSDTANTSTIRLRDDAHNNTLSYCKILGASRTDNILGGNLILAGGSNGGNSNNTITHCMFGPGDANLPSKCIDNSGTNNSVDANQAVTVSNCDFYDCFHPTQLSAGIKLGMGAKSWTISDNRFYQNGVRSKLSGTLHADIYASDNFGNTLHTIRSNTFGSRPNAPLAKSHFVLEDSAAAYVPINFQSCNIFLNNWIDQNAIRDILIETQNFSLAGAPKPAFIGIRFVNCSGSVTQNVIGSSTDTSNIVIIGKHSGGVSARAIWGGQADGQFFTSNQVGGITLRHAVGGSADFTGISISYTLSYLRIDSNTIGFPGARVLLDAPMGTGLLVGIQGLASEANVVGNQVAHVYSNQARPFSVGFNSENLGILVQNYLGGKGIVEGNNVHSIVLSHASGINSLVGLRVINVIKVDHNNIHSLYAATAQPSARVIGLDLMQGNPMVSNNMVRLGHSPTGQPLSTGLAMYGIRNDLGRPLIDHNSVYVGGTGVGDTSDTYAIYSQSGHSAVRMLNNIFVNARSNSSGTGTHYAIAHGGQPQFFPMPTTNGNDLLVTGNGGVLGWLDGMDLHSIADWRLASGQDYASISMDPNFVNPIGNATTGDLHIVSPTPVEGLGAAGPSVSLDVDLQARIVLTPRDIGADAANFVAVAALAPDLDLRGNGVVIQDGDTSPSVLDSTDLGSFPICQQGAFQRRYVLRNLGNAPLTLSGLTVSGSSAFAVLPLSVSLLQPGQQAYIDLQFTASTIGSHMASVTVLSNDPDEAVFTFEVQAVVTPDNSAPVAVCQPITVPIGANGIAVVDGSLLGSGSTDNCAITGYAVTPTQFTCADVGPHVVQLSISDAAGNASTCSGTITVADQLAPQALCNNVSLVFGPGLTAQTTLTALDAGSTDNCGIDSMWASLLQYTCAQAGTNAVVLSVRDSAGNVGTCIATVTVTEPVPPVAQCQSTTLQLDANGQVVLNPSLLDGGSTDNCGVTGYQASQMLFTCADVGVVPVMLTVLDGSGNADSCSTTVTVQDLLAPTLVCADFTITVSGSLATTIAPNMLGTATDACGIANQQLSQSQFGCQDVGQRPVTLTATDIHGNTSSCTVQVTVLIAPLAALVYTPVGPCGHHIRCAGETATASVFVSGGCGAYTYFWSNGEATPTLTGLTAGSYSVTITSGDGQQVVRTFTLVEPDPLSINLVTQATCFGANDGYIAHTTLGGQNCLDYHYQWSTGDTTWGLSNLGPGAYSVTVTDALGCTDTASTVVVSYPQMTLSVTQVGANLVASPGFVTYQWYKQNIVVQGATSAVLTPPGAGTYHVVVWDANGCRLESPPIAYPTVGLDPDQQDAVQIVFYPNPSTGSYTLDVSKALPGPITLELYDLHGRMLRSETLPGLESGKVCDYSELSAGAYIVELRNKRGSLGHYKLIRQ